MLLSGFANLAQLTDKEILAFVSGCFGLIFSKKGLINMLQHAPEKSFYHNLLFDADVWTPIAQWQVVSLFLYCATKTTRETFREEAQNKPVKVMWSVQVIGFIAQILFWKISAWVKTNMAIHFSTDNNSGTLLVIEVSSAVLYCALLCFAWGIECLGFIVAVILNLSLTFLPEFKGIVIMIPAICFYILLTVLKVSNRSRILATGVLEIVLMLFFAPSSFYAAAFVNSIKTYGNSVFLSGLLSFLMGICFLFIPTALSITDHARTMMTFALLLHGFVAMVARQLS